MLLVGASQPRNQSTISWSASDTIDDDKNSVDKENDSDSEECPMCREYLAGPCGTQFQSWLDCTNRHNKNNNNDYVVQCKDYFEELQRCLEQHQVDSDSDSDTDPGDDRR